MSVNDRCGDGDQVESYALTGDLPTGLTFVAATRQIVGSFAVADIPATPEVAYTLTATGGSGQAPSTNTGTYTFKIKYIADNTLAFASQPGAITGVVGTALAQSLPDVTGLDDDQKIGDVSYTLTPALPAGLTLVSKIITGTPTTAAAETEYTWKAAVGDDSVSAKFKITINAAPVAVSFGGASVGAQTFVVGTFKEVLLPQAAANTGTGTLTYTLTPDLPDGLTFASRILSGTATAAAAATEYTYKVTDSATPATMDTITFNITVMTAGGTPPTPANAPGAPTNLMATPDQAANTIALSWTAPASDGGSPITKYEITKTYTPTGSTTMSTVMINAGTNLMFTIPPPSAPLTADITYTFTVTATNTNGTGPASGAVTATLDADPVVPLSQPRFDRPPIGDIIWWVDEENHTSPNMPLASDLQQYPIDPQGYSTDPPLPAGLDIHTTSDNRNRIIAGTPTVAQAKTSYKWIYTAPDGADVESPFTITIVERLAPGKLMGLTAEQVSHIPDAESIDLSWDELDVRVKTDANNNWQRWRFSGAGLHDYVDRTEQWYNEYRGCGRS